MRSSYLSTATAAVICAAALQGAVASRAEPAEEVRFDALGNMVWDSAVEAAHAAKQQLPALTAPDFSGLNLDAAEQALAGLEEGAADMLEQLRKTITGGLNKASHAAEEFIHHGKVMVEDIAYDKLVHPAFPQYALRITSQPGLRGVPASMRESIASKTKEQFCDPDVYSVSGYLDISDTKHLFFVFFESRSNPKKDPLVLWLNGGPGCSSSTGLLFELGPCSIADEDSVKNNPHSWTNSANMIFLDQPVSGVGFSYSEEGVINNTPTAAVDVYAFLQLFLAKFPKYASLPFHIAGESYAGTYIPNFASYIHNENKNLAASSQAQTINLESVLIGNGLTDPAIQFPSVYDFACGEDSQYRIFDPESSQCQALQSKIGTCRSLIESCYKYNSGLTCTPAALYCWSGMYSPLQQSGLNLYDVRRTCDRDPAKDGPLCYREMGWIEKYMNKPSTKKLLGVPQSVDFKSCNTDVNQAFLLHGDSMHNSAQLLPPLIDDGIRVLIYAGASDAMCNSIGNLAYASKLNSTAAASFAAAEKQRWLFKGKDVGFSRAGTSSNSNSASNSIKKHRKNRGSSGAFGDFAFVEITRAGHMVPQDAPAESLQLFTRWLNNEALDSK